MNRGKLRIAIIGAGNVGVALASSFATQGHKVKLGCRDASKKQNELTALLGHSERSKIEYLEPVAAVTSADLILLTVPDTAIEQACEHLKESFKPNMTIMHCSGALASNVLKVAASQGCATASAHPLNTFPSIHAGLALVSQPNHSTHLFCEGETRALELIKPLFTASGFVTQTIKAEQKPLYHAACVFACNYLTVLMDYALQTAEHAGIDQNDFWQACQPIIQATLNNIGEFGTKSSLSGPVARGDLDTVTKHIHALNSVSPNLAYSYEALTKGAKALKEKAMKNGARDPNKG